MTFQEIETLCKGMHSITHPLNGEEYVFEEAEYNFNAASLRLRFKRDIFHWSMDLPVFLVQSWNLLDAFVFIDGGGKIAETKLFKLIKRCS